MTCKIDILIYLFFSSYSASFNFKLQNMFPINLVPNLSYELDSPTMNPIIVSSVLKQTPIEVWIPVGIIYLLTIMTILARISTQILNTNGIYTRPCIFFHRPVCIFLFFQIHTHVYILWPSRRCVYSFFQNTHFDIHRFAR
jgi:hypothetical protein